MKEKKYNKTAQESSSTAMRSNTDTQRSITERLGNIMCIGNVECTPEDDLCGISDFTCDCGMKGKK